MSGAVLNEDTRKSSLAELPDDCWTVGIRNLLAWGAAMGKVSIGQMINSGTTPLGSPEPVEPSREITFAQIVNPAGDSIADSDFGKSFRAKKVFHIAQSDRTRFEHLLSWETINSILTLNLADPRVCVSRDGRYVPTSLYRTAEGPLDVVNPRKLHELVRQNASVSLNWVEYLSPPARRLANQMEVALGGKVWVNCYITFGRGGALGVHFDAHDVVVLQLQGSKRWFIYDHSEPAPLGDKPETPSRERGVAFQTDLEVGDVLYIPRGTYHRAAVTDSDSLHITFAIQTFKRVTFIERILRAAQRDKFFREDVITFDGAEPDAEEERVLKARLHELIDRSSLAELVDAWQVKREPVYRFDIGPRPSLSDDTMLASLLRSRQAWRDSALRQKMTSPEAYDRVMDLLLDENFATVGELKAKLASVLDEDTIELILDELRDDCWIEVVRN